MLVKAPKHLHINFHTIVNYLYVFIRVHYLYFFFVYLSNVIIHYVYYQFRNDIIPGLT